MNISLLSHKYNVNKIGESEIPEVYALCQENPVYYQYCPPSVSVDSIRDDMLALPNGKTEDEKYDIGFYENEKLIAVMDLIDGYPEEDTAYIGFFMMCHGLQGKGIGTSIIGESCDYLKMEGFTRVKLGYVKENKQCMRFWTKNHFVRTGLEIPTEYYVIVGMERKLA